VTSSTRPRGCRRARRSTASWWTSRTYRRDALPDRLPQEPLLLAKGKAEPVSGVVGGAAARAARRPTRPPPAPLVGRARAKRRRDRRASAAPSAGGEPQIVTLVGPPGIGKSRPGLAAGRHLEGRPILVFWRQGRSMPYGDGVTSGVARS
jgi:hypothetical protein